jgi:hypothetical protein
MRQNWYDSIVALAFVALLADVSWAQPTPGFNNKIPESILTPDTVKRRPSRFPLVRFDGDDAAANTPQPAIVVLDNTDPTFEKDMRHHDELRAMDASGIQLWSHSGFNNAETVGGVHGIAIDAKRGRIYVRENVTDRITAFDLSGEKLWHIDNVEVGTLMVDDRTGNLWSSGGPNLKSGETVVFDSDGNEVAAYPYRAIDMVYDPHTDAFWLVGYEIIKLSRDGKILFREAVEGWCCPSASVNPTDGSVWIAERRHREISRSKNRLWLRRADGKVLQQVDLGDDDVFVVECEPSSGGVLFSGHQKGLRRMSTDGESQEIAAVQARSISVSPTQGDIWLTTEEAVMRIDEGGSVKAKSPFSAKSRQAWIAAF